MLIMELALTQSKSQQQQSSLNRLLPRWCQQWSDHLQHQPEGLPRQTRLAALHPEDSSRRRRALWFPHCRARWQAYCDRGERLRVPLILRVPFSDLNSFMCFLICLSAHKLTLNFHSQKAYRVEHGSCTSLYGALHPASSSAPSWELQPSKLHWSGLKLSPLCCRLPPITDARLRRRGTTWSSTSWQQKVRGATMND